VPLHSPRRERVGYAVDGERDGIAKSFPFQKGIFNRYVYEMKNDIGKIILSS
jgi:hypothetical protein